MRGCLTRRRVVIPSGPVGASDNMTGHLGEVLEFMRLLWAVDHGLQSVSKKMNANLGVTGPQRFAIRIIGRTPGISAGALAETLHLDPSTLTGVLQRLVERGAIRRISDPKDRRRALFALTPRGRTLDRVQTRTVEAAARRVLAQASPADAQGTRRVLGALVRELEAESESRESRRGRRSRNGRRGR